MGGGGGEAGVRGCGRGMGGGARPGGVPYSAASVVVVS